MKKALSRYPGLTQSGFEKIKSQGVERHYKKSGLIFSEGDSAGYIYLIITGQVTIFIQKFTVNEEICTLGPGEYFGEMAVFYKDKRNASAIAQTDTTLLSIDKETFLGLVDSDAAVATEINTLLAQRNEELILKEKLIETTGVVGKNFHISIKGDPSLRESTFTRGRYESPVDKILSELEPRLIDLIQNYCVYEFMINFNSGEIRTSSVFSPFIGEIHQANKLIGESYINRHFARIGYQQKTDLIKRLHKIIEYDDSFNELPDQLKKIFRSYYQRWQPLDADEISKVLLRLSSLRAIPDFYLRNLSISMTRDAIRMQFNCDGTHIVSPEDYQRFIDQNLEVE